MPPEEENRLSWPLGQQHEWGTNEYWEDQRQAQREAYEAEERQIPSPRPDMGDDSNRRRSDGPDKSDQKPSRQQNKLLKNTGRNGRKTGFKALFLTIPLGLIPFGITYSSGGAPARHLPLWQSVLFAVLIAATGVPKWRKGAIGFLVVALIISWVLGA